MFHYSFSPGAFGCDAHTATKKSNILHQHTHTLWRSTKSWRKCHTNKDYPHSLVLYFICSSQTLQRIPRTEIFLGDKKTFWPSGCNASCQYNFFYFKTKVTTIEIVQWNLFWIPLNNYLSLVCEKKTGKKLHQNNEWSRLSRMQLARGGGL